jgi:uncharacterized protein (DUF736 family)
MAIIGTFKTTENGYAGTIETLALKAEISIEAASKKHDNQPDYRVFHVAPDFTSDIGAAWKKTSREGAQYLSVSIDDPVLPGRISCRLVKTGSAHGHTLYWERPRPRDEEE